MNSIPSIPVDPTSAPPAAPLDLRRYGRILWRWKWLMLLTLVALPTGTYLLSKSNPKRYQSNVLLQVQPQSVDLSLFATGSAQPAVPGQAIKAAARLVTTTGAAQTAALFLNPRPRDPRALLRSITVTSDTDGGFLTISATDPSPRRAAAVANAFGRALVKIRTQDAQGKLDAANKELKRELLTTSPNDQINRRQLTDQIQKFRALRSAQGTNAQIVEPATANLSPVSPRPVRAAELAAVIALLIGLGLVVAAENLDRRIRDPSELEELTGLPLLGGIPRGAFKDEPSHREAEAFHTLRASLTYFNVDRTLSSVVVTSPQQEEGKTTVATNLALACARAGKDVILLDADLRRARAAGRLGLGNPNAGLGHLLVGEARLDEIMLEYDLEHEPQAARLGRLRVVPGGHAPPNPSELLASTNMVGVINRLEGMCQLVIIDTSPVLVVSDTMPLLEQVSGIVLVSRVASTSREAVRRAKRMIESAGGVTLGDVATGLTRGGAFGGYGYGGYYGDGYAPNGQPGRRKRRLGLGRRRGRRGRGDVAPPQPASYALEGPVSANGESRELADRTSERKRIT